MVTLPFTMDMLEPNELNELREHSSLFKELLALVGRCVIVSGPTMLEDLFDAIQVYDKGLVLKADGKHMSHSGTGADDDKKRTVLISVGVPSNVFDRKRKEPVQSFVTVARIWHHGETLSSMVAVLGSLRYHMRTLYGVRSFKVAAWNADEAFAFVHFRNAMFKDAADVPCAIHKEREVVKTVASLNAQDGSSMGPQPVWSKALHHVQVLKDCANRMQFQNAQSLILTYWALVEALFKSKSAGAKTIGQKLAAVCSHPFHTTVSGIPGHPPNTQSIESAQKKLKSWGLDKAMSKSQVLGSTLPLVTRNSQVDRMFCGERVRISAVSTVSTPLAIFQFRALNNYEADQHCLIAYAPLEGSVLVGRKTGDVYLLPALMVDGAKDDLTGKRQNYVLRFLDKSKDDFHAIARQWLPTLDSAIDLDNCTIDSCMSKLEVIHSCVMVSRVREIDMVLWPHELRKYVTGDLHGWQCTCLLFQQTVSCGHVYYIRYHSSCRAQHLSAEALSSTGVNGKSVRKPRALGKSHATKRVRTKKVAEPNEATFGDATLDEGEGFRIVSSPQTLKKNAEGTLSPIQKSRVAQVTESNARIGGMSLKAMLHTLSEFIHVSHLGADRTNVELETWNVDGALSADYGVNPTELKLFVDFACTAREREAALELHPVLLRTLLKINLPPWWNEVLNGSEMPETDALRYPNQRAMVKKRTLHMWRSERESPLRREDVTEILAPGREVTGFVLNHLLDIVQHEAEKAGHDVVILPTHLMTLYTNYLTSGSPEESIEWMFDSIPNDPCCRFRNWWTRKNVFIPLFSPPQEGSSVGHWILMHVKLHHAQADNARAGASGELTTYDSLHGPQSTLLKGYHTWFKERFFPFCKNHKNCKKALIGRWTWRSHYGVPPKQTDITSCGLFLVLNTLLLAFGAPKLQIDTYRCFEHSAFLRGIFYRMFSMCGDPMAKEVTWGNLYDIMIVGANKSGLFVSNSTVVPEERAEERAGERAAAFGALDLQANSSMYWKKFLPPDFHVREWLMAYYWFTVATAYNNVDKTSKLNFQNSRFVKILAEHELVSRKYISARGKVNWLVCRNSKPSARKKYTAKNGVVKSRLEEFEETQLNEVFDQLRTLKSFFSSVDERYIYDWNILTDALTKEELREWTSSASGFRSLHVWEAKETYEAVHGPIDE